MAETEQRQKLSSSTSSGRHNGFARASLASSQVKTRQISHLHAQIAQLEANLADLDNHLRVTSIQAEALRRLGGLQGGLSRFMATSRVLGERAASGASSSNVADDSSSSGIDDQDSSSR